MKTKFLAYAFLAFILLSGFVSKAQWQEDQEYGFKINIPSQWSKKSYMDGSDKVYDFFSSDQNLAIQLRMFKVNQSLTLDQLVKVYEENMLPQGTHRENLKDHVSTQGIPGKQAVYILNHNGTEVAMSSFFTVQNNAAYILTVIIPTNLLEQRSEEMKQITRSFTINGFESASKISFITYNASDQALADEIDQDMKKYPSPVGINLEGNHLKVVYLNDNVFDFTSWFLAKYANSEEIKNGITSKMQNDSYIPMGISSDNVNFYCLFMKGETNATAWQLVESPQDIQQVAKNIDPYLKQSYLPVGITLHGDYYYVLLIQLSDVVFKSWEIQGYNDLAEMKEDVQKKLEENKMPFGFLEKNGITNVLYVGL